MIPEELRAANWAWCTSDEKKQTVVLLHLREIVKRFYIACEPHPGLEPAMKRKAAKPPIDKCRYPGGWPFYE